MTTSLAVSVKASFVDACSPPFAAAVSFAGAVSLDGVVSFVGAGSLLITCGSAYQSISSCEK